MARKVGQIVGRGRRTWRMRVYNGRGPETKAKVLEAHGRRVKQGTDDGTAGAEQQERCTNTS